MVYPSTGGVVSAAAAAAEPSDVWRCLLTRERAEKQPKAQSNCELQRQHRQLGIVAPYELTKVWCTWWHRKNGPLLTVRKRDVPLQYF